MPRLRVKTHKASNPLSGPHTWMRMYRKHSQFEFVPDGDADVLLLAYGNEEGYRRQHPDVVVITRCDGLYCVDVPGKDPDDQNERVIHRYVHAHGLVFQSRYCRELFERQVGARKVPSAIIVNGTDMPFLEKPNRTPGVVCCVSWRSIKRPHLVEKLAHFLLARNPKVKVTVIGEYKGKELPNIQVLGRGSPNSFSTFYREHSTFVHTGYRDSCSNTAIEARAAGMIVVASESGGNPDLLEGDPGGLLYKENRIEWGFMDTVPEPDFDHLLDCVLRSFSMPAPGPRPDLSAQVMASNYDNFIYKVWRRRKRRG